MEKRLALVVFLVRKNICSLMEVNAIRMNKKLEKLSHRQYRVVRENDIAFKTLDGIELPVFVNELLY